jgi:hypothetical protein
MRRVFAAIAALGLCLICARASIGATPEEVDKAIERGKAYLYKTQKADGTWEIAPKRDPEADANNKEGGQWGGITSEVVYALLASGESPRDPKLIKAIDFMKKAEIVGTYAIAMRILACSFLPESEDVKLLMRQDHARLIKLMETVGNSKGMYDYLDRSILPNARPQNPNRAGPYSHSRAQYGVLGIWVATQAGIETPSTYWKTVEEGWIRNQDASGGWTYMFPSETRNPITPGMTAAGVASLYITQDYTVNALDPKGNVKNPAIEKGLAYLAANVGKYATAEKYERSFQYATMYAVERVGVASGVKYLGDVDWFKKGSDFLVAQQRANGSWSESAGFIGVDGETAFALLFLARGRAPVVVQKLQYDLTDAKGAKKEANWNQRPRDVANIVRYFGRTIERDVNWQLANLKAPGEDLLDAPILYISGNETLSFSAEEKAKLKAFVEGGGMILGHADVGVEIFNVSFRKLGGELFGGREFRDLTEKHPAYALIDRAKMGAPPRVQGLSNGARELMILLPQGDPARGWQAQSFKADRAPAANLMMGIFLYACEKKNMRVKGEDVVIKQNATPAKTSVKVARIEYGANWDPEPGAWPRFSRWMHNMASIDVTTETVKAGGGKLAGYKLAHLTGTATFRLDDAAKAEIKSFVESGGTLLVESCGGGEEFAKSAKEMLAGIFANGTPAAIAADHAALGGLKADEIKHRTFTFRTKKVTTGSTLSGIEIGGRMAVIVSDEDLSGGWVGHQFDGVNGYEPESAMKIGAAIVKYAGK